MSGGGKSAAIEVVLADDHALVRGALRALLEGREGIEVVGEAGDLAAAEEAVLALAPDVLVLDVNMPDGLAVNAIGGLRERAPGTRIVLLTMERDPSLARRALDAGAGGYLLKDDAHLELIEAVRAVATGGRHVSPAVAAGLRRGGGDGGGGEPLSPRETEVLRLLALGHTNREIAADLGISERTVEDHRAHVQQKLGLETRPELTRYALARGLLGP